MRHWINEIIGSCLIYFSLQQTRGYFRKTSRLFESALLRDESLELSEIRLPRNHLRLFYCVLICDRNRRYFENILVNYFQFRFQREFVLKYFLYLLCNSLRKIEWKITEMYDVSFKMCKSVHIFRRVKEHCVIVGKRSPYR